MDAIAREEGFIQRERKLSALDFIKCLLLEPLNDFQVSLRDHTIQFFKLCGKRLQVPSLAQRFTPSAMKFIQRLLVEQIQLKVHIPGVQQLLKRFTAIYIQDSTRFSLPTKMKDLLKGYGGAVKSDSMANIQFCYEMKQGSVAHLQLNDASYQDQTAAAEVLTDPPVGSLILRDLGYFCLDVFEKIHTCQAYFISRLKPGITIYEQQEGQWKEFDLKEIRTHLTKTGVAFVEKNVWLGKKKKLPVRLHISLAPADVMEKRLRKTNKHNKGKGHQTSAEYKNYAALNLFITNADEKLLSSQDIPVIYRMRWQIELIFKTWKSHYQIQELKDVNPYRILCYIYASLLLLLIHGHIFNAFNQIHYQQHKKWLSLQKFAKAMIQGLHEQNSWWNLSLSSMENYLLDLYQLCAPYMLLETRKKRVNYDDIIQRLK